MTQIPPIRVTEEELKRIDELAQDRQMSRAEYVRSSALHRRDSKQIVVDPIDFKFLSEVSILVGSILSSYRSKEDVILDLNELKSKIDSKLESCQKPD